jgi:hypothetical protein
VDYYRGDRLITLDGSLLPENLLRGCLDRLAPMKRSQRFSDERLALE